MAEETWTFEELREHIRTMPENEVLRIRFEEEETESRMVVNREEGNGGRNGKQGG